ncbi:hypothetical protein GGR77_000719 [Xanthomonas translucens]
MTERFEKVWLVFCALLCLAATQVASAKDAATLEDVAFLAGCWEGQAGDGTLIRETYTSPRGGSMLGNSQLVGGDKTQFFEFIQLLQTADGVVYRPLPNAKSAATFALVKASEHSVTFENAANDFPQRIAYSYDGADTLTARIEMLNGQKQQSFPMKAVPCGGEIHRKSLR